MARGGKREGAGRKPGSANVRTRETAERAAQEGITPLEVLLGAMREAWEENDKAKASGFAKEAAPYVHPRLQAVAHSGKIETDPLVVFLESCGVDEKPPA